MWKTVILDCCFAGAAFDGTLSATDQITDLAAVRGTCLLTACGETEFAWAPPEERHTAFSGELIRLLGQGLAGGPEFLDVEAIYRGTRTGLRARGGPEPGWRIHDDGARAVLARNRAWRPAPIPAPVTPAPAKTTMPPRLRREGIDVHIEVKEDGCHGIAGNVAYFETERALIGIDVRGGAVAWARPLGDTVAFDFQDRFQLIGESRTSVPDPQTGADSFVWSGDGSALAVLRTEETTIVFELGASGDRIQRILGVSTDDGSLSWELRHATSRLGAFLEDPGDGRTALALADPNDLLMIHDLDTGEIRPTGVDLTDWDDAEVTSDFLAWHLSGEDGRQRLEVVSLVNGVRRSRMDGFEVRGLAGPLAFRHIEDFHKLVGSPLDSVAVVIDEESRAAAMWWHRDRVHVVVLGDAAMESYRDRKTVLAADDGREVTQVFDLAGRLVSTHDRHFWRLDGTTAISAPRIPRDDGTPFPARVALLDVPTGRVTELGTITTLGNAVWSDTHLVAPTPDGVRIWRYRD